MAESYTRKPDATGRSSSRIADRRLRDMMGPPKGQPWIWHSAEMRASAAWRALGISGRRLIDFLEEEHMAHAGTQNGLLLAPYNQLERYGIARKLISNAVDEVEFLGWVAVERGGMQFMKKTRYRSSYRLTWLPDHDGNGPTNEWQRRTQSEIDRWYLERQERRRSRRTRQI